MYKCANPNLGQKGFSIPAVTQIRDKIVSKFLYSIIVWLNSVHGGHSTPLLKCVYYTSYDSTSKQANKIN